MLGEKYENINGHSNCISSVVAYSSKVSVIDSDRSCHIYRTSSM